MEAARTAAALIAFSLTAVGCAMHGAASARQARPPWDGTLQTHGALRAMHHAQQTGEVVNLGSLLPDPGLYAVGAMTDLAGEITVVGGEAHLSYPSGPDAATTKTVSTSSVGATLLVAAVVGEWRDVKTPETIAFEDLDRAIADLARSAGMPPGGRFPFVIEGTVEELRWHVIDGARVTGSGSLHDDHMAASVRDRAGRTRATLVGFFSESDQGVFTHMGSRTHIHCVIDDPLASGHVDHVVIPAGTTVRFPAS